MNPVPSSDDFEQRLTRTPLQPVPPAWKEDILRTARAARLATQEGLTEPTTDLTSSGKPRGLVPELWWRGWRRRLSAPWTILAAGWVLVAMVQSVSGWVGQSGTGSESMRGPATRSSGLAVLAAARMHQAELLALAEPDEAVSGDEGEVRPALPWTDGRPRSEVVPGRRGLDTGRGPGWV